MKKVVLTFSAFALIGAGALRSQNTFSAEAMTNYQAVKANIMKAAEKMPDDGFGFKATPAVRNFGELIAHVADAQMGICSLVKGDLKRGDAASKTTKVDLIAALKASDDFCDAVYSAMTDADGMATVKSPLGTRSKLGMLNFNAIHDNEMYGTMSVYLRLKDLVPPSTEGAAARKH